MRAVSKSILLLLLVAGGCATTKNYQNVFQGTFYGKYLLTYGGISYEFEGDTFNISVVSDFGTGKKISRGTFKTSGDTLILNFIPMKRAKLPSYRFISKELVSSGGNGSFKYGGSVTFKIVNRQGKPLDYTTLAVGDNAYVADSLGVISDIPVKENIHQFRFSRLGYFSVIIPADTLRGFHSRVKVILSKDEYSDYSGTKKYLN